MKILGLDQSLTASGLILMDYETENILECKVIKTNTSISESKRIKLIGKTIEQYIVDNDIDRVYLEGIAFSSKNSSSVRVLGGLFYYLLIILDDLSIPYEFYPPTSIKKFALKGNSKKEEMFNVIPDLDKSILVSTGYKKTTGLYDLSDAYWIAKMGISLL